MNLDRCQVYCHPQVSHLNLPQFIPTSPSVDDVSYRHDHKPRITPLDLSRLQQTDAPALTSSVSEAAAASVSAMPATSPAPELDAAASKAVSSFTGRTACHLGSSRNIEQHAGKLAQQAQHGNPLAAQLKWPPSPGVISPQPPSRPALQPSSWQLSSAASTARNAISPRVNNSAAKTWQQIQSTASAHEQWVLQRHTVHGRMSGDGDEEEWGQLMVRVPKQAASVVVELVQQLPEALAGAVHADTPSQVQVQLTSNKSALPNLQCRPGPAMHRSCSCTLPLHGEPTATKQISHMLPRHSALPVSSLVLHVVFSAQTAGSAAVGPRCIHAGLRTWCRGLTLHRSCL